MSAVRSAGVFQPSFVGEIYWGLKERRERSKRTE